jgi:hypothetical protein
MRSSVRRRRRFRLHSWIDLLVRLRVFCRWRCPLASAMLLSVLALGAGAAHAKGATSPLCSAAALAQAGKLLAFHMHEDDRIDIDPRVRVLPALINPADRRQRFDVLEVLGAVYKGSYRMRLIYARVGGECVLMGQEILELAKL